MENLERIETNQENSNLNTQHSGLKETLKDLSGVFSSEGQQEFKKRNEKAEKLLTQLKNEVQRISEELNYDYSDYEKRLLQSDEYIEKVKRRLLEEKRKTNIFQKIFSKQGNQRELSNIRKELAGIFQGMEEVVEKKFFREYLEDLVYEKMDTSELEEYPSLILISGKLIKRWQEDKEKLKVELLDAKNVDVESNNFGKLGKEELKTIFENLQNIRNIRLHNNNLGELGIEELKTIFENLQNVRSINLTANQLWELGIEKLKTIFENLQNMKNINLAGNQLGELGIKELKAIFENLQNVKNINLAENQLGNLGKESLRVIFGNLQNVRSINLRGNKLSELGEKELRAIFENLHNVRNIELEGNNLGKLGKERLKAIFENLHNVRNVSIQIGLSDFSKKQKKYIQSLLPDDVEIEFN